MENEYVFVETKEWNTGDAYKCEEHQDKPWPHDNCIGPGMPDDQGRVNIKHLTAENERLKMSIKIMEDSANGL